MKTKGGEVIEAAKRANIHDYIMTLPEGTRFQVLAPVVRGQKGMHEKVLTDAKKSGYARVRIDGSLYDLGEEISLDKNKKHDIEVVVDRLVLKEGVRSRLGDSVETALKLSGAGVVIDLVDKKEDENKYLFFSLYNN